MSFQIKDFVSIVAAQVNHARGVTDKITDFQPGSVARTLMEAPAIEMEELYLQMLLGLRDAIPVATFRSFGFTQLPAAVARGYVSVSAEVAPADDLPIPLGTSFTALDGRTYLSTEAVTWPAGVTIVRIPVVASIAGAVGNVADGVITSSPMFGEGYAVSNPAIATGRDLETDPEREARFADFIASLSQGTLVACSYKAGQAQVLDSNGNRYEYVIRQGLIEQPGYVRIFIYSSRGEPSEELLAVGQRLIDGERDPQTDAVVSFGTRAGGIRVDVLPMIERAVPLEIRVAMQAGYDLDDGVRQQLGDAYAVQLSSILPGTIAYLGDIIDELLAVEGVLRIVPVTTSNIACAANEVLVAGNLVATALDGLVN